MSTLQIVFASASGLVLGYATASHLGSRARSALESSLKREQEKLLKGSKQEIKELEANVKKLKGEGEQVAKLEKSAAKLKTEHEKEAKAHKESLAKIQAELEEAKANSGAAATMSPALQKAMDAAKSGLDDILKALVDHEGQKAALLADSSGIAIASAGDQDSIDRISAATGTLTGIPKQLDTVLKLDETFSYQLSDGKHSIAGCSLVSAGELIALTLIGTQAPSPAALVGAVERLTAALE